MKKIITLITLSLIASFSYAQSLDLTSTAGFSIDSSLDTFGSTVDSSGVSFSGSDFGNTVSGQWASAIDLSSWSSLSEVVISGSMTSAPTSNFSVVLYDSAFATFNLSGGSWTNISSSGSDALTLDSGAGFNWASVQYIDINTGGLGDTVAGTLTNISAVPEPSTYALIAGFAAFLFVAIRRRK
jgi:hypothetical protein